MDAAEAVLTFLRSVGKHADAEYYLRQFRDAPRECFAAIAVDAATMTDAEDAVALDLRFLSRLELTPIVVLGLRDPGNAQRDAGRLAGQLESAGVDASQHATSAGLDVEAITASARATTIPIVILDAHEFDQREAALTALLRSLQTRKLIFLRNRGGLRLHGERLSVVNVSDELDALSQASDLDEGRPTRTVRVVATARWRRPRRVADRTDLANQPAA